MLGSVALTNSAELGSHQPPKHMCIFMRVSSYRIIEIRSTNFQFVSTDSCLLPARDELVKVELSH
jgi:hypothetical protein